MTKIVERAQRKVLPSRRIVIPFHGRKKGELVPLKKSLYVYNNLVNIDKYYFRYFYIH
jgi:hypothetical protein